MKKGVDVGIELVVEVTTMLEELLICWVDIVALGVGLTRGLVELDPRRVGGLILEKLSKVPS